MEFTHSTRGGGIVAPFPPWTGDIMKKKDSKGNVLQYSLSPQSRSCMERCLLRVYVDMEVKSRYQKHISRQFNPYNLKLQNGYTDKLSVAVLANRFFLLENIKLTARKRSYDWIVSDDKDENERVNNERVDYISPKRTKYIIND